MARLAGYRAGILILPNAKTFLNIPELSAHVTGKMIIKFRTNVTTQPRVSFVFLRAITHVQIFLSSPFPDTGCSRWRHLELGVPGDPFHLHRKHHYTWNTWKARDFSEWEKGWRHLLLCFFRVTADANEWSHWLQLNKLTSLEAMRIRSFH